MSSSKKTILGKHIVYHSWIFSTQKVKIRIFLKDHRSRNNSMTIIVISSTKLVPIDILYHVLPSNYHSHMMRKIKMAEKWIFDTFQKIWFILCWNDEFDSLTPSPIKQSGMTIDCPGVCHKNALSFQNTSLASTSYAFGVFSGQILTPGVIYTKGNC